MAAMKITVWPKYQRTGSPTVKAHRRVEQIASAIFAELLPRHTGHDKARPVPATLPPSSAGIRHGRARTRA
ncbi:MAG: hypothetical protein NZ578_12250 [Candidatus Binatia bacterium]|nr:hypothetical protein [Candidatus Binatia bacterium]